MAGKVEVAAGDLAALTCEGLWLRHNSIFKAAGYCFKTPVSEDYHVPFKFTGDLKKVAIQLTDAPLRPDDQAEVDSIRAEIGLSR